LRNQRRSYDFYVLHIDGVNLDYQLMQSPFVGLAIAKLRATPIKVYDNFYNDRSLVLKDASTLGPIVYCLINLVDGKTYIGSSVNPFVRFSNYLSATFLQQPKNVKSPISQALLKYKPSQFALVVVAQVHDKSVDCAGVVVGADLSQRVPFSSLHSLFNISSSLGPL
jgi:hypothetical protein